MDKKDLGLIYYREYYFYSMQYDYSSLSNANNLILITQFLSNSILEIKN